jgi:hypothetical protein
MFYDHQSVSMRSFGLPATGVNPRRVTVTSRKSVAMTTPKYILLLILAGDVTGAILSLKITFRQLTVGVVAVHSSSDL